MPVLHGIQKLTSALQVYRLLDSDSASLQIHDLLPSIALGVDSTVRHSALSVAIQNLVVIHDGFWHCASATFFEFTDSYTSFRFGCFAHRSFGFEGLPVSLPTVSVLSPFSGFMGYCRTTVRGPGVRSSIMLRRSIGHCLTLVQSRVLQLQHKNPAYGLLPGILACLLGSLGSRIWTWLLPLLAAVGCLRLLIVFHIFSGFISVEPT